MEKKKVKKTTTSSTVKKKMVNKPSVKKTTTKKKPKKKKIGFTLIELLAVIIILGVVMIIAIPSVTKYISKSKKDSYVYTAQEIVSGARVSVNDGSLEMYDPDTTYFIPAEYVKTEGSSRSPYGEFVQAYVGVIYQRDGYKYYWISVDETGQGIDSIMLIDQLKSNDIHGNINAADVEKAVQTTGIGERSKIKIFNVETASWIDYVAENNIGEEGGSIDFAANAICRKATVLHTKSCGQSWQYGCKGDPAFSTTITYGTIWDGSKDSLKAGDALDCKVKKDGDFTERFYYIGENDGKAVLIYYANIERNGSTIKAPSQKNYAYNSEANGSYNPSNNNNYGNYAGPITAITVLPTNEEWDNIPLIGERTILSEKDTNFVWYDDDYHTKFTIKNPFSYGNKVARLLTVQDIKQFVGDGTIDTMGYLNGHSFLFENIAKYDSMNGSAQGYWLETPTYSSKTGAWTTNYYRDLTRVAAYSASLVGVRPVIEIPMSKIVN